MSYQWMSSSILSAAVWLIALITQPVELSAASQLAAHKEEPMNRMPALRSVLALAILLLVTLWAVPAYPWHGSGNITALAIAPRTDPETPTTLYAGTSDRGVFKSTDGGASWSAIGLTNNYVLSLAIDPQTPSTVYAGTWGGGVFKTADGGGNWSAINNGLTDLHVADLAVDPQAPATLYAVVPGAKWDPGVPVWGTGVFKSTDGGATWNAVLRSDGGSVTFRDLAIDPQNPVILYASMNGFLYETEGGVVLKSTDGGASWYCTALCTDWWSGPVFLPFGDLAVAPQTSQTPTTVYAAGGSYYSTVSTVFKSADEGASWIELTITQSSCCVYDLAIDPVTPTTLYAGTPSGAYKSADAGATWGAVNTGLTDTLQAYGLSTDVRALVIDPVTPTTLYAGTDLGVFKSTNGAGYWNPTGLFQHSPLSSVSLNPTHVVEGTASTGTVNLIAAAPVGGVTVTLSSSNPAVATVPASVTVAAGATSASFTVSTSAVDANTEVTISAAFDDLTKSAYLSVRPAIYLSSLSLSPTSVPAGSTSTGTVTLSAPAQAGGKVVKLSSGNTAVATVPASVTVAAGATSANFTVSTSSVLPPTYVSISVAILANATAYQYLQVTLPAAATLSSLSLEPATVSGGGAATGTVVLSAPAPAGGAAVALSSSNPAVVTVPATATVPAGSTSANFALSTTAVTTATAVTITVAYGGQTRSMVLNVVAVTLSSLSVYPASVAAGSASTGTVTLSAPAPLSGALVTLSSSNTAVATVASSVTVPAGAASANFSATTAACSSGSATISGIYGGVTRSAGLTASLIADTVTIQQADYFASKHELRVAAKSSNSTATLKVYVTSSGELVGTLRNLGDGKYSGQLSWPVNPQNVRVVSSQCGSATRVVRSK